MTTSMDSVVKTTVDATKRRSNPMLMIVFMMFPYISVIALWPSNIPLTISDKMRVIGNSNSRPTVHVVLMYLISGNFSHGLTLAMMFP